MTTVKKIIQKGLNFLEEQNKEYPNVLVNIALKDINKTYKNNISIKEGHPQNLDDTINILINKILDEKEDLNAETLVNITNILTSLEKEEGGPYYSLPNSSEIDLALNSNIAYFLSLLDIKLENLESYFDQEIQNKNFKSNIYKNKFLIIYFLSKHYKGQYKTDLIYYLLEKEWNSSVDSALAISALLNLGYDCNKLKTAIQKLILKCQNGIWQEKTTPLYQEDSNNYIELNTAFCLEALAKFEHCQNTMKENKKKEKEGEKIYNKIIKLYKNRINYLDGSLKIEFANILKRICKSESKSREILLLSFYFNSSLENKKSQIDNETIISLGLANLWGWIAYTIYDDFLDNEGDTKFLSVANFALRELTNIFNKLTIQNPEIIEAYNLLMDKIDEANNWEIKNCRVKIKNHSLNLKKTIVKFNNLEALYKKSIAHSVGPVTILLLLGYKLNKKDVKNLIKFFEYYLTAKQLNDDIHDWEEDLKNGQINIVCNDILKEWQNQNPKKENINLKEKFTELQNIFWENEAKKFINITKEELINAKTYLNKIKIIKKNSLFYKLLNYLEISAAEAVKYMDNTNDFIEKYNEKL